MSEKIKWKKNLVKVQQKANLDVFSKEEVYRVRKFHESFPQYQKTPLISLEEFAKKINIKGFYIKDESYRFGLNAFKVLGGSYAIGKYLSKKLGEDIQNVDYKKLTSKDTKEKIGDITFITATDGNHGRGVAWTANKLAQKSVVYMPKGSSITRLNNIKAEGAKASITNLNYDDAVRLANKDAQENNWIMVQDTAWESYEEIPTWIMQGYGTMASEALDQLKGMKIEKPTHIFVQAGVGSLAGAVQGFFAAEFKQDCPKTIVVEANLADCLYKSISNDGNLVSVGGEMPTIMAGLACGEANTISWEILKSYTHTFVSCPDWVSAYGMRILGNPIKDDERVISGESGAVTTGLIASILMDDDYKDLREELELNEDSVVLVFSTEGDTDPKKYREIVWNKNFEN